jgi:septum formation protein
MNFPAIYLASQSPRRAQLLTQIGVSFELLLPQADEDAEALELPLPHELPAAYVLRVTQLKAQAAIARMLRLNLPVKPVLAADTVVAKGSRIYGKPKDAQDAILTLRALSGTSHSVLTAVAIALPHRSQTRLSKNRLRFARLSTSQIQQYVASNECFGKAGAYAIQGKAATFVRDLQGSYSGVMGLPLFETADLLGHFVIS